MSLHNKPFLKAIILGDSSVGKTSLLSRYVTKRFHELTPTIASDFYTKEVMANDRLTTLQIWDTAGQERYQCIGKAIYRDVDCCILVFDVSKKNTFKNIIYWREEFIAQSNIKQRENFPFILLGNKVDCDDREVTRREAEEWCISYNMTYFETSALDGFNVEHAFRKVAKLAAQNIEQKCSHRWLANNIHFGSGTHKKGICSC